jgi:hypothetical protein
MPYVYECDGFCDDVDPRDERPALTGEFNEHLYDATPLGDQLKQAGYDVGDLVTLCPACTRELLTDA